jgi:hypothetical protein
MLIPDLVPGKSILDLMTKYVSWTYTSIATTFSSQSLIRQQRAQLIGSHFALDSVRTIHSLRSGLWQLISAIAKLDPHIRNEILPIIEGS